MSRISTSVISVLFGLCLVDLPATAEAPIGESGEADASIQLLTKCILVRDAAIISGFHVKAELPATPGSAGGGGECAELGADAHRLTGTGDLVIAVEKEALAQAQASRKEVRGRFLLFINGVPLPNDAVVMTSEEVSQLLVFRFRIQQGPETQRLWSVLYADGALIHPEPLYAALGWAPTGQDAVTLLPVRSQVAAEIAITTPWRMWIAGLLVALTMGTVIYFGYMTDILRDSPDSQIPPWWRKARGLKADLSRLKEASEREARLRHNFSGYDPAQHDAYKALARSAIKGEMPEAGNIEATGIGLALLERKWRPLRASYSLSRTQLALWFTFAVITGIFLWLLYGELRRIDDSLLVLLGISAGTAGLSWITDRSSEEPRPYTPSLGFWSDLITGFDERKQLHRYQAVIINLLLLVVGVFHVQQQLSYPVFEQTWLIFLGISGSAYGMGKQMLENK